MTEMDTSQEPASPQSKESVGRESEMSSLILRFSEQC